jgi:hypothetical protein
MTSVTDITGHMKSEVLTAVWMSFGRFCHVLGGFAYTAPPRPPKKHSIKVRFDTNHLKRRENYILHALIFRKFVLHESSSIGFA